MEVTQARHSHLATHESYLLHNQTHNSEPSCTQPLHTHTHLLLLHTHGNLAFLAATNSPWPAQLSTFMCGHPLSCPLSSPLTQAPKLTSCKTDESCQKQVSILLP